MPDLHTGYAVVAAIMVPILLLNAWAYRPKIAERATVAGLGSSRIDGHRRLERRLTRNPR